MLTRSKTALGKSEVPPACIESTSKMTDKEDNFLFQEKTNKPIMDTQNDIIFLNNDDTTLDVVIPPFNETIVTVPTVVNIDKSAIFVDISAESLVNKIIDTKMPESYNEENNPITLPQVMNKLNTLQQTVNDLSSERTNLCTDVNRLQSKIRSFENYKKYCK